MRRFEGKRIYLLGDSISSTDYVWYKEYLSRKTGAEVYNAGFSGHRTRSIAADDSFRRLIDFDADLTIALVLGNDDGAAGTVGTFSADSPNGRAGEPVVSESDLSRTFYDRNTGEAQDEHAIVAVSHIIRKWKALFYDFKAAAGVDGPVEESDTATYARLDAVKRRRLVFCTTLPQKRYDDENPFSRPENWQRKRQAILECCEKYNIPCLDLYTLCRWDWEKEPYWVAPTSMTCNRGIYTMDGLHPNRYGYDYLTDIVASYIEGI